VEEEEEKKKTHKNSVMTFIQSVVKIGKLVLYLSIFVRTYKLLILRS
jgi:hypothetical protein